MLTQQKLRDKALVSGVELIAPDTIFKLRYELWKKYNYRALCQDWTVKIV